MLGRDGSRFFSRVARPPEAHASSALSQLDLKKAPSFLKLLQHYQEDRLSLIQAASPPRTGSTSAFRSLAEAKETSACGNITGAIFEPFLNRKKNIPMVEKLEHGARSVLQRAELLGINFQRVTLVTKEIASYLPVEIMQHWQTIVNNFVFIIEDPHKQMYSFLQMLANGRTFGIKDERGMPLLDDQHNVVMHTEEKMRALWPAVTEMLAKNNFQQTGWGHLTKLIDLVALHCHQWPHKKMVIIDASILKLTPEETLSNLTKKLNGCTFTPAMVSSWDRTSGKLFFHPNAPSYDPIGPDGVTRSMWIWPALKATQYALPVASCPTDDFPPKLADHILKESLPAYYGAMNHPAFLLPANIAPLIEKGSKTCPITLVALLKIMIDTKNQSQEQYKQLLSYYDSILNHHPKFLPAFDVLFSNQSYQSRPSFRSQ